MVSLQERFNKLDIKQRAYVVTTASKYLEWFTELSYIYHIYNIDCQYVVVQYDPEIADILDIWMLSYKDLDWLVQDVNIDEVWEK